jgi:hypothetical protein
MILENHGSTILLRYENEVERAWLAENCLDNSFEWAGGALSIGPRFLEPVLLGLIFEGFTIKTPDGPMGIGRRK